MTKRVLVVFSTAWDQRQLEACRASWEGAFEVCFAEPSDEATPWDFDVLAYIEREVRARRGAIDGVFSASDYPGASAAGAIATELGLPGSRPRALLLAAHKYYSRVAQREVVPEAVPGFAALDPDDEASWAPPALPCFVKPVKGAFSIMTCLARDAAELAAFLRSRAVAQFRRHWVHMFDRLLARHVPEAEIAAGWFLSEELLVGHQVTLEGFEAGGEVSVLGIVDSTFRPGTRSFTRFDYPSALPESVQERMASIVRRLIPRMGLEQTLFNVELTWDEVSDRIGIIEVNPRLCGQFADLYEKVDGTSGYALALELATGGAPRVRRGAGRFAAAASFPLRAFEPARARRVPGPKHVRAVETAHPGALVWLECEEGEEMLDFTALEDGHSHRYAIVNLGAGSRVELELELERVRAELGLELERLG